MRIISDTEEGKTYFVFNYQGKAIFEENVSSSKTQQISLIYALNRQIARVEGIIGGDGEIIYYHHDNLGSTRLVTYESGEVVFDQDYLPFGGDLAVVGELEPVNEVNEGYKYTGQREEAVIGLYYYGARFYDPELGRFITEDTYIGVLTDPQSQNLYIYVMNNPMKYVDPTGMYVEFPSYGKFAEIEKASKSNSLFDYKFNLGPFEYEFSLINYSFTIPDYWQQIYEGVSFREYNDFVVLKVQYEAIANNTIETIIHINDKAYIDGKAMTVKNTISTFYNEDDIIFGGTGTFFYLYNRSFAYRAFGHITNKGIDMTPEELYGHYKYYNIKNHRAAVGYDKDGFAIGRGKDNQNLITSLTGLTLIMEDGKFTNYHDDIIDKDLQYFTGDQLYSTKHMMFGINRNNRQELYIFSNKVDIGFKKGPDKRLQNIIKELGLTDVAKGDGGGSTQWWLCNDFSLQYENRPLGNMILIRKGQGK